MFDISCDPVTKTSSIRSAFSIQYQRVTDRQTDIGPQHILRNAYALDMRRAVKIVASVIYLEVLCPNLELQ